MRAVFPVFLVVLGLSAREYVDLNVRGGLAYADRTAIVSLAQETAIAGLDWAFPSWRSHHSSRSMHRHERQRVRQTKHAQLGPIYRIEMRGTTRRLRGFGQRDRSAEPDRPVEITFVVPVERKAEAALRRGGRGEHRRR